MQMAVDNRLQKILYNETTMFIDGTRLQWKSFDHAPGAETLPLSMVHARDLIQLLCATVWKHIPFVDTGDFPYHSFCVPYLFRCKYLSSL